MKLFLSSPLLIAILCILTACSKQDVEHAAEAHSSDEKPTQHLQLEDLTSATEAASVFAKEVAFITGKQELTAAAMNNIHMSTYSLEKAVAYYCENTEGPQKVLADKIAVVVEQIHLASENNRAEETQKFVDQLGSLVNGFQTKL